MKKLLSLTLLAIVAAACTKTPQPKLAENEPETMDIPECVVTSPPDSLQLDPFYKKYVDVNGIPLISSWRVPDSCFVAAHRTLYAMTSMLSPEIMNAMRKAKARVGIMARYEGTTDIPEHHYLVNDTALNWDLRARGLGGRPGFRWFWRICGICASLPVFARFWGRAIFRSQGIQWER